MIAETKTPGPLVVVERILVDAMDPKRVSAIVIAGGHRLRVVLDFSRYERLGIEYVEMPKLLDLHRPSQQAVMRLMARAYEGEVIDMPVDLTEEIQQSPPSPYEPITEKERASLEALADKVNLEIMDVQGTGKAPLSFTATLRIDGREFCMIGEIYAGSGRIPFLCLQKGPDPESLSKAQWYAIERALIEWQNEQR
jgi:hypothetical protein